MVATLTSFVDSFKDNPTHQVIRLLEEFKKSQKSKNTDVENASS